MIKDPRLRPLPEGQVLHVAVPDMPPVLTPAACHALLKLLRTHSRRAVGSPPSPTWGRTG
jgi:hypothetical protein